MNANLKLFEVDFGERAFVVAENEGEAIAEVRKYFFGDDAKEDEIPTAKELPMESVITIHSDEDGATRTKTVKEWIESSGPGFLASTLY